MTGSYSLRVTRRFSVFTMRNNCLLIILNSRSIPVVPLEKMVVCGVLKSSCRCVSFNGVRIECLLEPGYSLVLKENICCSPSTSAGTSQCGIVCSCITPHVFILSSLVFVLRIFMVSFSTTFDTGGYCFEAMRAGVSDSH